ncbi:unnamed protein product, partial [Staurois parvus]
ASVVRQAGSIIIGQVGTRGSGRENGQGHKPGIKTGEVSRGQDQTGSATRTGTRMQDYKIQGPGKKTHTPRQRLQVWPSLKYTCLSSFRCLAGCRVESLIAGSTRWPALVLQPTRQVSPTITGKSIPNRWWCLSHD